MRILFICGGIEPGKDGVGDYTRKLTSKLISMHHQVAIMAINDNEVVNYKEETQNAPEPISVVRIPNKLTWDSTIKAIEKFAVKFRPDIISVQYVPYSFHEKGLPFTMIWKLGSFFKQHNLQIMMHELWVDGDNSGSMKHKIVGFLQKGVVRLMLRRWKPLALSTSIPLYKRMLKNENIEAQVLPIFSNISNFELTLDKYLYTVPEWLKTNREDYIIGCNFGSFYTSDWEIDYFFGAFEEDCIKLGKKPLMYSIGNLTSGQENWDSLSKAYPKIEFLTLGPREEEVISYWFSNFTDFGIVTTPYIFAGKSGSYMAFKQHGLPCFCDQQSLKFNFKIDDLEFEDSLIPIGRGVKFHIPAIERKENQVAETAKIFLASLKMLSEGG